MQLWLLMMLQLWLLMMLLSGIHCRGCPNPTVAVGSRISHCAVFIQTYCLSSRQGRSKRFLLRGSVNKLGADDPLIGRSLLLRFETITIVIVVVVVVAILDVRFKGPRRIPRITIIQRRVSGMPQGRLGRGWRQVFLHSTTFFQSFLPILLDPPALLLG